MAQIFLSDFKATLDNCIAELEEIHFMFCKNPESDFTRNRKLLTISSSCFRCRANQFQMKSWISMNNLFQPPQNLPLRSRDTNFSQKAGTFCSIHFWSSAGLCLTAFTTVTGFWPAMAPMSTSHATLRTKGLLSTKEKKLIMQSTSMPFTTSPIRLTAIFLSREKEAS